MTSDTMWTAYTDGACAPSNPGPAGWGVVVIEPGASRARHPALELLAQLLHVVGRQRRDVFRDERPDPAATLRESLEIELAVGPQHGVRVDGETAHDLLHGRQLIAGPEDAEAHRLPDLLDDLQIGGHSRACFKVELDHLATFSR